MAFSIRDVARRAGVSIATVSRVLNASGRVAPVTARRVRRAAQALDYRVNAVGRSLATARTGVLGVLVPTLANPVFSGSVTGLARQARRAGYDILLAVSDYDAERELEVLETFLSQRVEGLALTLTDPDGPAAEVALAADIPLVLLFNIPKSRKIAHVAVDDYRAGREMVEAMVRAGHRRVAMVTGRFASSDRARRRYDGYLAALSHAGLEAVPPLEVPFLDGDVRTPLETALGRRDPPTAFFCSNDLLALAVIDALRALGRPVPAAVSVAGFDGIEVGRLIRPRLSTVVMPTVVIGETAFQALLGQVHGERKILARLVPHEIDLGGTIGPRRPATARGRKE